MKRCFFLGGLLVVLGVFVFGRTVGHEYVIWDDGGNVYENPQIPLAAPLSEVKSFWVKPYDGFYIPVVYTVWAGIASVSERVPSAEIGVAMVFSARLFHLVNVALHLGSSLMVFAIFYRLLGRRDPSSPSELRRTSAAAALGAAVFAVHPLQVEAVAWVTGLKDVLSAFLALACMLVYLRQAEFGRKGAARVWYWGSVALFVAALLCKTNVVGLPVALVWFEYLVAPKTPVRRLAMKLAPFAVVGVIFAGITFWGQFEPIPVIGSPVSEKIDLWKRVFVALDALTFYASKVVYPFGMAPDYGRNPGVALRLSGIYPLWAVVPVLLFGLAMIRKGSREMRILLWTGLGVAGLTLGPVLGLVQFGFQEYSTVADRYMYFPMVGVGLCVAAGGAFLGREGRGRRSVIVGGMAAVVVMVLVLALEAGRQAGHWRDTRSLFTRCLEINPESLAAYLNLTATTTYTGEVEESIAYREKLIRMVPRWSGLEASVSESLGRDYVEMGRFAEALPLLKRAVELEPGSEEYRRSLRVWYEAQGLDL